MTYILAVFVLSPTLLARGLCGPLSLVVVGYDQTIFANGYAPTARRIYATDAAHRPQLLEVDDVQHIAGTI